MLSPNLLPAGQAQIFYGLTQDDANKNSKASIWNFHSQKVKEFRVKLDSIIEKVKTNAAKQKQESNLAIPQTSTAKEARAQIRRDFAKNGIIT